MPNRYQDPQVPQVDAPVPPMPAGLPVSPPAPEAEPRRDEKPDRDRPGVLPGNGTHPHAPPRPPAEREP